MSLTAQTLAIRNVTLINGTGAALQTRATVIVDGDRISAVGGSRLSIPDDAETIDGSGKFLIPGLMDVHVHVPGRIVRNGKGDVVRPENRSTGIGALHSFLYSGIMTGRRGLGRVKGKSRCAACQQ